VVEKELLHHDILREMSEAGLLAGLTFIGGTCLRACYGSPRLSEDLDFTGGRDFKRAILPNWRADRAAANTLQPAGELSASRSKDRWQSLHLEALHRNTARPTPPARAAHPPRHLRHPQPRPAPDDAANLYGIDLGTSGLILQAQSREEILADKIIALAFRENRIKNRDLWDIAWLVQQGVELPAKLIPLKIRDHQHSDAEFATALQERTTALKTQSAYRDDFVKEMRRFLPATAIRDTVEKVAYWSYLTQVVDEQSARAVAALM
jgi:predicted nucleotidyltransferase component of viral defense system